MTQDNISEIRIPRIMIAAPSSGSGKTLLTCALLRLMRRKGIRAAAFKCGPDFIDPMFHKKVLGTPSRNLDLYLAGEEGVRRALLAGSRGVEVAVIEGVMGYYDGTGPSGMEGSSYSIACATQTPVILTADARGMSRSAAALMKGFAEYGEQKLIRGAFLNRVTPAMSGMIGNWLAEESQIPALGSFPVDEMLRIESRHLGLVEPDEISDLMARIDHAADILEQTLDLEQLMEIAKSAPLLRAESEQGQRSEENGTLCKAGKPVTIAVAEDEAFSFYYEDNLELLEELGAEIVRFSPVHDKKVPDADGLLLGGGYPELKARELASNTEMLNSVRQAADGGMPILAECGGFQYLQEELVDSEGNSYKMAGVLKGRSTMTKKLVRFGYVEVSGDRLYFDSVRAIRGHEFHYSDSTNNGDACRAVKPSGKAWNCMVVRGRIAAGYPHLYYRSDPEFAKAFIRECEKYREERGGK